MKGIEYFMSLQTSVVLTEVYNVKMNSDELRVTEEYLTLDKRYGINRCRYNRVILYFNIKDALHPDALRDLKYKMNNNNRRQNKFIFIISATCFDPSRSSSV